MATKKKKIEPVVEAPPELETEQETLDETEDDFDLDALLAGLDDEESDEEPAEEEDAEAESEDDEAESEDDESAEAEPEDEDASEDDAPPVKRLPPAPPPPPVAPAVVVVLPPPVRTPPTLDPVPPGLSGEAAKRWELLNGLIQNSWESAGEKGTFWFTLYGRQDRMVVLLSPADAEPNKTIGRKDNDSRAYSMSGYGKYVRYEDPRSVAFQITSGQGRPDIRSAVVAEVERLGYFTGYKLKF